jgi:long-chain acyl-CoA synthetase
MQIKGIAGEPGAGAMLSPQSLDRLVAAAVDKFGNAPAYICLGAKLSFRQLDELSDQFAAWLLHGVSLPRGSRIAIQLPNLFQYPVAALGILKAGMVIVNINPLYSSREIHYQLQDSGAVMLIVLANTAHNAAAIVADTCVQHVVVTEAGDLHEFPHRQFINAGARFLRPYKKFQFADQHQYLDVLRLGRALLRQHKIDDRTNTRDDLAVLQYTGGTTGIAKGAMLTHGNLVTNILQLEALLDADCPGVGAIMLGPLPLYHIYAFNLSFLTSLHRGHTTLLIPNPKDMKALIKAVKPYRLNGVIGINTLYRLLFESAQFRALDFSQMKISASGGMALSPDIADKWEQLTGVRIIEGYGMTECSPVVACNRYLDFRRGTVGRAAPGTQLCLKDEKGNVVPEGEVGEICVKGPQVMKGYWQRESENSTVFDDAGWLHTGDLGVLDEAGYLRIVDRIKDMIIISGFNVFPNEIEDHACSHPEVLDACAIAVGDECASQVKLFVVVSNPNLSREDIINHCRSGLAAYKVPRHVEFRSSLPKSEIGKVLRRRLRDEETAAISMA